MRKGNIEPYIELLQSFLSTETTAPELEGEFFRRFKSETKLFDPPIFAILDRFFGDLDAYCEDPALRDDDDLDEAQLRVAAARALRALTEP